MSGTQAATTAGIDPIGATEAAAIVGVHRANFVRDWAERPGFPAPIGSPVRGRLWDRAAVENFALQNGPSRGVAVRSLPLSADAARWMPSVKRRIVRAVKPLRVVLFGSQATGGARPDSDFDLLVVMPDGAEERVVALEVMRALRGLPISKDVIVTTPAKIRRYGDVPGTMVHEALGTGRTIYARP
jgi:predicted nucleotidyltransferase